MIDIVFIVLLLTLLAVLYGWWSSRSADHLRGVADIHPESGATADDSAAVVAAKLRAFRQASDLAALVQRILAYDEMCPMLRDRDRDQAVRLTDEFYGRE